MKVKNLMQCMKEIRNKSMVFWMGKKGQNSKWYFTKIALFEKVDE